MDYQRLFEPRISSEAARLWKTKGKKTLGVICCHLPMEILRAADVLPIRLRATDCVNSSDGETWMSSLSCTFAKSILQYWLEGIYDLDGMVTTDGCLMASRLYDNAEFINDRQGNKKFYMQIAAPRKTNDVTINFYRDELKDLVEALEKFTGNKITDQKLKTEIIKYNEARGLVRELYELRKQKNPVINGEDVLKITLAATDIPIEEYIELLKSFLADAKNRPPIEDKRARLMIFGSALDNPKYLKIIEDKGGLLVADVTCFGEAGFGDELIVDDEDVLGSIAKYYLERLVCPRMMDNREKLHKRIIELVKEYNIDGVIFQKMQYCECWSGESILLEDEMKMAGIPLLTIEREEHFTNVGQIATRAEAFIEMIEGGDN